MGSDQKRALIAVVISGIFLFGWQKIYSPVETSRNSHSAIEKPVETINNVPAKAKDVLVSNQENKVASDFLVKTQSDSGVITFDNLLNVKEFESSKSIFNYSDVVGKHFSLNFL